MPIPKKFQGFDLEAFLNDPDTARLIGPNFDFFAKVWRKDFLKKQDLAQVLNSFHWNTLGIFVSPVVWFAYRRMYGVAAAVIVTLCALSFGFAALRIQSEGVAFLGVTLIFALMSYGFYFNHVFDTLQKIKSLPMADRDAAFKKLGGVSARAAWGYGLLTLASLTGFGLLELYLFEPLLWEALWHPPAMDAMMVP